MPKKISLCFLILVSFSTAVAIMGQDFKTLSKTAEDIVRLKRPDWKLRHKIENENQVSYTWGSVRRGIGVSIFYGASETEAVERMAFKNKIMSVGPGKKRTGFGEEAYSSKSGEFAHLRFRKANVYIELTAPTMAMAEALAKSLANEIRKK